MEYVDVYARINQITTETAEAAYLNFIGAYRKDVLNFMRTGRYPTEAPGDFAGGERSGASVVHGVDQAALSNHAALGRAGVAGGPVPVCRRGFGAGIVSPPESPEYRRGVRPTHQSVPKGFVAGGDVSRRGIPGGGGGIQTNLFDRVIGAFGMPA